MRLFLGLLAACGAIFAQDFRVLGEGITATATRVLTLQADEARITVDVTEPLNTPLEQALRLLEGTGFQAGDLISQNEIDQVIIFTNLFPGFIVGLAPTLPGTIIPIGRPLFGPETRFRFQVRRPAAALASLAAKLKAISESPAGEGVGVTFSGSLAPSATAIEDLRQIVQPQLITEARRRAEALAGAANLKLGDALEVSSENPQAVVVIAAERLGGVIFAGLSDSYSGSDFRVTFTTTARWGVR